MKLQNTFFFLKPEKKNIFLKIKKIFWILPSIASLVFIFIDFRIYYAIKNSFIYEFTKPLEKNNESFKKLKSMYANKNIFKLDSYSAEKNKIKLYYAFKKSSIGFVLVTTELSEDFYKNKEISKTLIFNIFNQLLKPNNSLILTAIPPKTRLLSYRIQNKNLILNLSQDFFKDHYGKLGLEIKLAQILKTFLQFSDIESVEFTMQRDKYSDYYNTTSNEHEKLILNRKFKLRDLKQKWTSMEYKMEVPNQVKINY